jgi:hypothetical protein
LLVGPKTDKKNEQGARFHARERGGGDEFHFVEQSISMLPTQMILVRILIAKVEDKARLAQILRQVPVRREEGWNCVAWVKEALLLVKNSKGVVGTSMVDWEDVRDAALTYCQQKRDQHRFDGSKVWAEDRVPTFDLLQDKETIE